MNGHAAPDRVARIGSVAAWLGLHVGRAVDDREPLKGWDCPAKLSRSTPCWRERLSPALRCLSLSSQGNNGGWSARWQHWQCRGALLDEPLEKSADVYRLGRRRLDVNPGRQHIRQQPSAHRINDCARW